MASAFPPQLQKLEFIAASGDSRARQLIEAAYELLDEGGLEGLTIRAVLARTGLARRAFYDNFASKDELMLVVFAETIRLAAQHYRSLAATHASPRARLAIIVTSIALGAADLGQPAYPGSDRRSAALSREHLRLAESRPDELQAALAPLLALFAELLRAGMATGELRAGDPELLAMLIYNLVSTTAHAELLAAETGTPDPARRLLLAQEVWAFCERAIGR